MYLCPDHVSGPTHRRAMGHTISVVASWAEACQGPLLLISFVDAAPGYICRGRFGQPRPYQCMSLQIANLQGQFIIQIHNFEITNVGLTIAFF